jgi:hypothetical protein
VRYANVSGVGRAEATSSGQRGACPSCGSEVTAKCGSIVANHWAHIVADCDPWSDSDNEWRRAWQDRFPEAWREVHVDGHRAHLKTDTGLVVLLIPGSISADEVSEREAHFGTSMCWIVDVRDAYEAERLDLRTKPGAEPTYRNFRWKHAHKSLAFAKRTVFLDLGNGQMFRLGKLYKGAAPNGGWGHLVPEAGVTAGIAAFGRSDV